MLIITLYLLIRTYIITYYAKAQYLSPLYYRPYTRIVLLSLATAYISFNYKL